MKNAKTLLILCAISTSLHAETVTVGGTVATTCAFNSNTGGVMTVVPSAPNSMSTVNTGGSPATLGIQYIGTPTILLQEFTGFDTSPTLPATPTFTTAADTTNAGQLSFTGGATSYTQTGGSSDTIHVNFSAVMASGNSYPTGAYSATTTITCQ